jgi:hypothetical protein
MEQRGLEAIYCGQQRCFSHSILSRYIEWLGRAVFSAIFAKSNFATGYSPEV